MRRAALSGVAVCAAIPLLLMLVGPAAHAEDAPAATPGSTLVDRIVEAAEAGATAPAELSEEASLPADGGGSLTFDAAERITATVMFAAAPDDAVLAAVGAIAEIDELQSPFPAALVRVAPAELQALATLPGVVSVTPALRPFAGGVAATTLAAGPVAAAPRAAVAEADACGPIPIEADGPLRSDEARERFGVDGAGVTVGIISDSFASLASPTSWADDVASGALPGPGNPCGYETPVHIVSDANVAGDEGRAMAQLVHGIAPGATLMFADAGSNDFGMANNIDALVAAGADIIVDDITWPQETAYQQGFISVAIEAAKAQGVAYFTSAGNSTGVGTVGASTGRPLSSWSTTAYRAAVCPDWLVTGPDDPLAGATDIDCLDFDTDPATETPYDTLVTRDSATVPSVGLNVIGSIGEPAFGVTTSYEWRFYAVEPGVPTPQLIGQASQIADVLPGSTGQVTVPTGSEIRAVMVRTGHDPAAPDPAVLLNFIRGGDVIAERAHLGDGVTDRVGPTTFGHAGDGSGLSVASLDWEDPAEVRSYSSLGPATLLFEPVSREAPAPAGPLAAPVTPATPNIAAVDGTQTTFFGDDTGEPGEPEYRFFGTSAAAPNTAAVAALALSYRPQLTGAELSTRIQDTARGTAAGGPVNPYLAVGHSDADVFGAGIVDATALLEGLTSLPVTPQGLRSGTVTSDSVELAWDPVADASGLRLQLVPLATAVADADGASAAAARAADDAPGVVAVELDAGATSYRFAKLSASTVYAISLTAVNPVGESPAATIEVTTAAAPVTPPPTVTPVDPPVTQVAQAPLAQTGGSGSLPLVLAGVALLLVGAGVVTAVAIRRRRAAAAAATDDAVSERGAEGPQ
ncbi:S8 family serine peptidase [Leucobacter luti]|uniref:LPXTG-motif cell wall-anchored protein n=1 Tax=Leucobacter luti TaxID=340320 RepID=A0A4Q7U0X2_9MICO|nr:S8 family serine peptidase [Leucobacter luti]RZT66527.1 LPXTG-motif cell wall-anchored protein [Leucobacter luti]